MNNFQLQLENFIKDYQRKLIPDIMMVDSSGSYTLPKNLSKHIKCILKKFVDVKGDSFDIYSVNRKEVTEDDMLKFTQDLDDQHIYHQQSTKKDYDKNLEDFKIRKKIGLTI